MVLRTVCGRQTEFLLPMLLSSSVPGGTVGQVPQVVSPVHPGYVFVTQCHKLLLALSWFI